MDRLAERLASSDVEPTNFELSCPGDEASPTLQRAREARSVFIDQAEANEHAGELTPATISAAESAGLFKLQVSKAAGGLGANSLESLRVLEEVCSADASTGWVLMACNLAASMAASYLPVSSRQRLFDSLRFPIMAGQGAPNGKAVVTNGGFHLSGKWNYGSGIKHADHVLAGAFILEGDKPRRDKHGDSEVRLFYVPKSKVTLADNWDVIGLRATGSIDYSMENVFVEDGFDFSRWADRGSGGEPIYGLTVVGLASLGHTAFALGVGRRVLDEIALLSGKKIGPNSRLSDSEGFQEEFALAEARYAAMRALVYQTWSDTERRLQPGQGLTRRQLTYVRLALNVATSTVHDICLFAYKAGGGVSLRAGPIQRYFRDMSAGLQHMHVSRTILRDCGRELLGVAGQKRWASPGLT